jgi:hypothetical protein
MIRALHAEWPFMALLSRALLAALMAAATVAAGMFVATPANADVNCPSGFVLPSVNPDCYFLNMMARNHAIGDQTSLINEAHIACGYMANATGSDPVSDAAVAVLRDGSTATFGRAAIFANLAAAAYCPWYIRQQ